MKRSAPRELAEDASFAASVWLLGHLPDTIRLAAGRWLGRAAHRLLASRRRVAVENLERVYAGDWDSQRVEQVARESFESLGQLVADFALLPRLDLAEVERRVSYDQAGERYLREALDRGRGVILVTAHSGSWELMPYARALAGQPCTFVTRPADNTRLERRLVRIRGASGNRVVAKQGAARELLRELRRGGMVGILVDQAVSADRGVLTSFMGRPAYTTPAPAQLALRTGATIMPVFIRREPGGRRHQVVASPPIEPQPGDDPEQDVQRLSQRIVDAVELWVRQHPEQWLWCHRRWRHAPPAATPAGGNG